MSAIAKDLTAQLEQIRKDEKSVGERHTMLVNNLIEQLQVTHATLELKEKKLASSEYTCDKLMADLRSRDSLLDDYERNKSHDPFVLVLVDGDDTLFIDDLVKQGADGGDIAAQTLRNAVADHLRGNLPTQSDAKILISIYANVDGLSKTYAQAKILPEQSSFTKFIRGFNKSHAFCDFVDAGNDKEAADTKIREKIDLFYRNIHCQHIVLGASRDNSYTFFLRKLSLTNQVNNRITLLKSKPFPQGLAEVAPRFRVVTFPDLFRQTDLLANKKTCSPPQTMTPIPSPAPSSSKNDFIGMLDPQYHVRLNALGQRVDTPIDFDESALSWLKKRKVCHRHFLTHCIYKFCPYQHKGHFTAAELEKLRICARSNPCHTLMCKDKYCVASHQCIYGDGCKGRPSCRFPSEMHGVDTRVVNEITSK